MALIFLAWRLCLPCFGLDLNGSAALRGRMSRSRSCMPAGDRRSPDGVIAGLAKNRYDLTAFAADGEYLVYHGSPKASRGIDVSSHQGRLTGPPWPETVWSMQ